MIPTAALHLSGAAKPHNYRWEDSLGFSIPYFHKRETHDCLPDFIIIRFAADSHADLILVTKGHDDLAEVKTQAAQRWVAAVNAAGGKDTWGYAIARSLTAVKDVLDRMVMIAA